MYPRGETLAGPCDEATGKPLVGRIISRTQSDTPNRYNEVPASFNSRYSVVSNDILVSGTIDEGM